MKRKTKAELESEIEELQRRVEELQRAETGAEAGAWESHALLQGVIELAHAPVFVKDRDSHYRLVNTATARALGKRSAEQVIGKRDTDLIPPELAGRLQENDRKTMESGGSVEYEEEVMGLEGRRLFWTMKTPYRDEAGAVVGLIGIARDITARREAEEQRDAAHQQLQASEQQLRAANQQLQASEQQLRAANQQLEASSQQLAASEQSLRTSQQRLELALDASNSGVWELDPRTFTYTRLSDSWLAMLGYAPDDLPHTTETWTSLLHPQDLERVVQELQDHLQGKGDYSVEFRMKRKDGSYSWVSSLGKVVSSDQDGEPERMVGIHVDITRRKQAESRLQDRINELTCLQELGRVVASGGGSTEAILEEAVRLLPPAWQYLQDAAARIVWGERVFCAGSFPETGPRLSADLMVEGRKEGVVEVAYHQDHLPAQEGPFVAEERALLATFTERLGHTVERVQARLALAELNRELESRIEERTAELKDSEQRLRFIIGSGPAVLYSCQPHGDYGATFISENIAEQMGYEASQFVEDSSFWASRIHPDDAPRVFADLPQVFEKGQHSHEYRFRHGNGSYMWMHDVMRLVADDDGKPRELLGLWMDITERRHLEDSLRSSRQRLAEEATATAAIVNELLAGQADDSSTERQVLDACLAATRSKYGMIGVINEHGNYDSTTYNSETLGGCAFPEAVARDLTTGMTIRGVWGWPMLHGEPLICNDLAAHPGRVGQPEGHVPIECFLGVPIKEGGKVAGMVAVANKTGGYSQADEETLSRLVAIMAVSRKYRQTFKAAMLMGAELERKVRERTAELEAANKELEAFAYSVSHDLRSPLRGIDGYAQILLDDYRDKLDDDGRHVLGQVLASARDMERLIEDLLQFSRMGRGELSERPLDLAGLVRGLFEEIRAAHPERQLLLSAGDLPPASGDSAMIREVLRNLLGNAVKFTAPREVAEIEVGAAPNAQCATPYPELGDDATVYFVKDNGVGFDMRYSDKLFAVFQRLHGAQEFEGSGIGLAMVQRIIHRHGGKVWAEGAVGRGAVFYFALPATRE